MPIELLVPGFGLALAVEILWGVDRQMKGLSLFVSQINKQFFKKKKNKERKSHGVIGEDKSSSEQMSGVCVQHNKPRRYIWSSCH